MEQPAERPMIIGEDREFVDVRMADLRADSYGDSPLGYQRAVSESQIQDILASFEDELRKDTIVSRRVGGPSAGTLYVVDGQHTLDALKRKYPDPEQRIKVSLRHWTREQEAKAFLGQRENSRGVSTLHNFRVALEHREPWAVHLNETVEAAGGEISLNGNRSGKHLTAIAAARGIMDTQGWCMLFRVVEFLVTNFPDDEANLGGRMLTGLANLFSMHPEVKDRELAVKLKSKRIDETPASLTKGGINAPAVTQRLIDIWNYGRQDDNQLSYDRVSLRKNSARLLEESREEAK